MENLDHIFSRFAMEENHPGLSHPRHPRHHRSGARGRSLSGALDGESVECYHGSVWLKEHHWDFSR